VRHGDADHLKLSLATGDEQMRLQVRDDGTGFEDTALDDAGMGIRIMNYRARIIGGTLDLNSSPGTGTIVTCTLPQTNSTPDAPPSDPSNADDTHASSRGCPVSHE
jgi:two-component system CheB/CheR fusion protein